MGHYLNFMYLIIEFQILQKKKFLNFFKPYYNIWLSRKCNKYNRTKRKYLNENTICIFINKEEKKKKKK